MTDYQVKKKPAGARRETMERLFRRDRLENGGDSLKGKTMENKNLIAALCKAQTEIVPPVKTGTNPMFKNKYATLDAIYDAIRLPLASNGLVWTHSVEETPEGKYILISTLFHVSGESIQNRYPMKVDKDSNQGIASARTYACRYATSNMFALPSDEDDDGNIAEGNRKKDATLSTQQCKEIEEYVGNDKALCDRILAGYKVKSFSEINSKHFAPIMRNLQKRGGVSA